MQKKIAHAQKVISTIASKSDRAIIFYSCGKDSMVLLDLIAPHFKEITLVFMYFVKDLWHINKYLLFAQKKYPNIKILQVPHWCLSSIYQCGIFCPPNPKIKLLKLNDIDQAVREKTGIDWVFYGMKASDSMNRRFMMKEYELSAISKTNKVYPLALWKQADVLEYVKLNKLPKPISYTNKKKSQGLTFDINVFLYLQKNYPQDLKKILAEFPLSEKILIDHQNSLKNGKSNETENKAK